MSLRDLYLRGTAASGEPLLPEVLQPYAERLDAARSGLRMMRVSAPHFYAVGASQKQPDLLRSCLYGLILVVGVISLQKGLG